MKFAFLLENYIIVKEKRNFKHIQTYRICAKSSTKISFDLLCKLSDEIGHREVNCHKIPSPSFLQKISLINSLNVSAPSENEQKA